MNVWGAPPVSATSTFYWQQKGGLLFGEKKKGKKGKKGGEKDRSAVAKKYCHEYQSAFGIIHRFWKAPVNVKTSDYNRMWLVERVLQPARRQISNGAYYSPLKN